jgi:hypothetical protein
MFLGSKRNLTAYQCEYCFLTADRVGSGEMGLKRFGELALLLPNTDLDLVFFGPGVVKLLEKAQGNPSSLARRPFVYTYRAPKVSGAGTIRIELSRSGPLYDGMNLTVLRREKPDAIVALRSDLSRYSNTEWKSIIFASRTLAIPFAITKDEEFDLRHCIELLLRYFYVSYKLWLPTVNLTSREQQRLDQMAHASYLIELNPFMYPGPRPTVIGYGPSSLNGYTLVVTPGGSV